VAAATWFAKRSPGALTELKLSPDEPVEMKWHSITKKPKASFGINMAEKLGLDPSLVLVAVETPTRVKVLGGDLEASEVEVSIYRTSRNNALNEIPSSALQLMGKDALYSSEDLKLFEPGRLLNDHDKVVFGLSFGLPFDAAMQGPVRLGLSGSLIVLDPKLDVVRRGPIREPMKFRTPSGWVAWQPAEPNQKLEEHIGVLHENYFTPPFHAMFACHPPLLPVPGRHLMVQHRESGKWMMLVPEGSGEIYKPPFYLEAKKYRTAGYHRFPDQKYHRSGQMWDENAPLVTEEWLEGCDVIYAAPKSLKRVRYDFEVVTGERSNLGVEKADL